MDTCDCGLHAPPTDESSGGRMLNGSSRCRQRLPSRRPSNCLWLLAQISFTCTAFVFFITYTLNATLSPHVTPANETSLPLACTNVTLVDEVAVDLCYQGSLGLPLLTIRHWGGIVASLNANQTLAIATWLRQCIHVDSLTPCPVSSLSKPLCWYYARHDLGTGMCLSHNMDVQHVVVHDYPFSPAESAELIAFILSHVN